MKIPSGLLVLSGHSMVRILSFCPLLLSTCWIVSVEKRQSHSPPLLTSLSHSHCSACSPFLFPTESRLPFSPLLPLHSCSPFPLKHSIPKFTFAHRRFTKNLHHNLRPSSFQIPGILVSHYADQGSAEICPQFPPSNAQDFIPQESSVGTGERTGGHMDLALT